MGISYTSKREMGINQSKSVYAALPWNAVRKNVLNQKNPAKRWIFCYLESMYIDSTKFPISVIKRIIPAIVVNVAIEAKGLKNITSPNAKWSKALINIIDQEGEDIDFKLNANWNLTINCIINQAPIIIPKNSFKIEGFNINSNPIIV